MGHLPETKRRAELVRELYQQKLSIPEIVEKTGIARHAVYCHIYRFRREGNTLVAGELSEKQKEQAARRVLVLRTMEENPHLTNLAIANELDISIGTVSGIIARARGSKPTKIPYELKADRVRELCANGVLDREIARILEFPSRGAVQAYRKRRDIHGPHTNKGKAQQPYSERYQKPLAVDDPRLRQSLFDDPQKLGSEHGYGSGGSRENRRLRPLEPARSEVVTPVFRFGNCQYPMWRDNERTSFKADGTPHFCGAPSAGSWCAEHRSLVFTDAKRWAQQVQQVLGRPQYSSQR